MPDLFGEQSGLTLLAPFLIDWLVGLTPPLLIRFVLMRRPIGIGWALVVAALFGILHYALVTAFGGESKTYDTLVLIAIVSLLILTAGKKDYAPVVDQSKKSRPKAASSEATASIQNVRDKKKESAPNSTLPRAPAEPVAKHKPAKLELPQPQGSSLSASEEEAELHRYEIAWRELETGETHRGLWGRAFVKAEGDEKKTKIQYLKERTDFLKKVEQRQEEQRRAQKLRERQIQEQMERERFERMARLNQETLRQNEEHQHRHLLKRISLEQSETVNMLREGINKPDKWNEFKLTNAAQFGSDENVLALLAAGANPLLRDNFGHTARDYAKQKGRTEIAQHLAIAERIWKQKSLSTPGPRPISEQGIEKGTHLFSH